MIAVGRSSHISKLGHAEAGVPRVPCTLTHILPQRLQQHTQHRAMHGMPALPAPEHPLSMATAWGPRVCSSAACPGQELAGCIAARLQAFLKSIASHPVLRECQAVNTFLLSPGELAHNPAWTYLLRPPPSSSQQGKGCAWWQKRMCSWHVGMHGG